jgi:thiamine-phosphate diphosphorylase/hydroxyethylthiazole kinase
LINDRLDIALAVGCGLHVGQGDMPAALVRKLLGNDVIIGVSVNSEAEIKEVIAEGIADYVGEQPPLSERTELPLKPVPLQVSDLYYSRRQRTNCPQF